MWVVMAASAVVLIASLSVMLHVAFHGICGYFWNPRIEGWGEAQPGNRFGSVVRAYARSGSEVGIGENRAGPPPFPFPFRLRRVFRSSFLRF